MVHRPLPEAYHHFLLWHDHKRQAVLLHVLVDGILVQILKTVEPSLTLPLLNDLFVPANDSIIH